MDTADVVAHWPLLTPLMEVADPPWVFEARSSGAMVGLRRHDAYIECLWAHTEERSGMSRRARSDWCGPPVRELSFRGRLVDTIALLRLPVRWEQP